LPWAGVVLPAATTVGRLIPRWILWTMTFMSTVLPDCASVVPELWQITQYWTSVRGPPWNASLSWQALHTALLTMSRV
jgi:hypothetical protein